MASNDFLPYAVGGSANVLTQSAYAGSATLLANGLQSGIVPSNQINKTLRQPSIIAAVIGQLIADVTGQNATDDGTTATLEANLARVILGAAAYSTDTGAANAYVLTLAPVPLSYNAGMSISFVAANANTGASTLNVNGTGALALTNDGATGLSPGQITAGMVVKAAFNGVGWQILNPHILTASSALAGVSRFGTNAEQLAGTLSTVGCTPAGLASGQTIALNGIKPLPGGLYLQWGFTASAQDDTFILVTMPGTFPNSTLGVWGSPSYGGAVLGSNALACHVQRVAGGSQIRIGVSMYNGFAIDGVYWCAIGY